MEKLETPRVIVDTDILIDLLRNNKPALTFITQLENQKAVLATTAINAFELYYGAHKSNSPKKASKATRQLLNRLVLLSLTSRAAKKAGHIYAELERQGTPIGLRDTLIAAVALIKEFSIATNNKTHFNKIQDLKIITQTES